MFKTPALTFSRYITTVIYLFIFSHSPEVLGQTVHLDSKSIDTISACSMDLRNGLDHYIVKGIVDATTGKLSNFVDFQIQKTTSNSFTNLCTVTISTATCITPNPQSCYCAVQNGSIYEIVAKSLASVNDSDAKIRIQWTSSSSATATSDSIQVPTIYDVNAVATSLTLNNNPMTCPATVTHGSEIKVQCLNSPRPCNISIALNYLNNTEIVKVENSAIFRVPTNLTSKSSYNLVVYYSVCGGSPNSTTCPITIEEVTTTVTTSTTAVTNGNTSMKTGITDTLPTTNSTFAPIVQSCSLNCYDWAIALSVIYYIAIIAIIFTGITILVLANKGLKKTVVFYLCIGFLVFAEVLDIILIIVFAQADPCTCDPEPDNELALWEIMLIIFCIVDGLLIIAAVLELIFIFVFPKKKKHSIDSNSDSVVIPPKSTTNTGNTRTPKNDTNKSGQTANTSSNGKKTQEKNDEKHEMSESKNELPKLLNTPDETNKDEAETPASDQSQVKELKKKKSSKRKKANKDQDKESLSHNRPLPDLQTTKTKGKNVESIHSQTPTGTKMPLTNPYE